MLASGFVLYSDHHFHVAIHNRLVVEVWQQGQLIDYGSRIDAISEHSVTINGAKHPRGACEFKVR